MNQKTAFIAIGLLLCTLLLTNSVSASGIIDKIIDPIKEKFELKSELEISVDENSSANNLLIQPGTYKNITVNVKYRLNVKPIVSKFITESKIGKILFFKEFDAEPKMNIKIEAKALDYWYCYVAGSEKTITVNLSDVFQETSVNFKVFVEPNAQALNTSTITFSARTQTGDLNIEHVSDSTQTEVIYGGDVIISVSAIHLDIVEPGEVSAVPITIKNWGDLNTTVDLKLLNTPETWEVELNSSSFNLGPADQKTINLNVKAKSINSKDETVKIKFTPKANVDLGFEDESFIGQERYFEMDLLGSNIKNFNNKTQDLPGLEILSITLALIIVCTIIFISKRKKK